MRRQYINDGWKFSEVFDREMVFEGYNDSKMCEVRLPHSVKETPLHYFDESVYQMESGYRRCFATDEEWTGKRVFLTIEAAAHEATVYFNGKHILTHSCGYTAFRTELTELLKDAGGMNVLTVKCDSRESLNVPPFGHVVDYMTYGGLYREAYLEVCDSAYIKDVYPGYGMSLVLKSGSASFSPLIDIDYGSKDSSKFSIRSELLDSMGEVLYAFPTNEKTHTVSNIEFWSVDNPVLYQLHTVLMFDGTAVDERTDVMAFRSAEFRADGFYLNGSKLKLRGLNRHQSYPYVGYAMPESMQRLDAQILKNELGCNVVRTSHYPQSQYFIDECDRLGLLVFMEFPGWQHIGDSMWKEQAVINEEEMILQYRNHPSIIIWGVRINESQDDEAFYKRTNELAHRLDPMRQTGGVRAMKKGQLLEDVYTYNDFVHSGSNIGCEKKRDVTPDVSKGYLITEFNGHMFPTKAYDTEEHRLEHSLRHANVVDAAMGEADVSGCIGWCMFDYNTHKDFGSGDRVCYHGVMDMFRNPKLAANIYACEQEAEPVLELSSSMDIGEHPGCNRGKTFIFTNADSVRMYKNGTFIKEFSAAASPYKNLKHGPIVIDDFIGDEIHKNENFSAHQADIIKEALNFVALNGYTYPPRIIAIAMECMLRYHMKMTDAVVLYNKYIGDWGGSSKGYRFEAIKDGKVVKTIVKQPMTKMKLHVRPSAKKLFDGRTYDVCELRLNMCDENGNVLNFFNEPVAVECEGPVEIIGPTVFSLEGGMGGVYIRTKKGSGKAGVTVKCAGTESVLVELEVYQIL